MYCQRTSRMWIWVLPAEKTASGKTIRRHGGHPADVAIENGAGVGAGNAIGVPGVGAARGITRERGVARSGIHVRLDGVTSEVGSRPGKNNRDGLGDRRPEP